MGFIFLIFVSSPPLCHSLFYKVIFCFPRGSESKGNSGWLGYAYLNSWAGYYNDNWCSSISTLGHEIGHNLNLGHSGLGNAEYGDTIGIVSKNRFCRFGSGWTRDISVFILFRISSSISVSFFPFFLAE